MGAIGGGGGDVEEGLGHAPFCEVWREGFVEFDHDCSVVVEMLRMCILEVMWWVSN